MAISVFDLFSIGVGPSSSHTVGPMRAARLFVQELETQKLLTETQRVVIKLYGSLGATGKGHGSDKAVLLGLQGESPEAIDPETIEQKLTLIRTKNELTLLNQKSIPFNEKEDLLFLRMESLPLHPNGMSFEAQNANDKELLTKSYYSVGGGFIIDENESGEKQISGDKTEQPYPFHNADTLLEQCKINNFSISELIFKNELSWRSADEIWRQLRERWKVMQASVQRGYTQTGILPGGLKVPRRAAQLYNKLIEQEESNQSDDLKAMDWVNMYAIAVNEENAAGGKIVTAPTNGAAGIIPAVMHYALKFHPGATEEKLLRFLLTAGAIGILYKENASISGADVGCQGEVGVACSMAAGALAELSGGTINQVENAAEIGMEHNLGLTCDPIGGLVQIPCIERNAMGSVKAINAARLALKSDGQHFVSLDKVIKTMWSTGKDMQSKYKETSRGGLAVNLIEC